MWAFWVGLLVSYKDYLVSYDQYRQSHSNYVVARQAYLNYQTLTAKNEAQSKTLVMLKSRNETLKTYLTVLRDKIKETDGVGALEEKGYVDQLENEIEWYQNYQEELSSAGTLEDLLDSAKEGKRHYHNTETLAYQVLTTVLAGKENLWRNRVIDQVVTIRKSLADIKEDGNKNTAKAERWLLEAENRITRSLEKQQKAEEARSETAKSNNRSETYNQIQFILAESHQYLKEANSFLRELMREIKTAD